MTKATKIGAIACILWGFTPLLCHANQLIITDNDPVSISPPPDNEFSDNVFVDTTNNGSGIDITASTIVNSKVVQISSDYDITANNNEGSGIYLSAKKVEFIANQSGLTITTNNNKLSGIYTYGKTTANLTFIDFDVVANENQTTNGNRGGITADDYSRIKFSSTTGDNTIEASKNNSGFTATAAGGITFENVNVVANTNNRYGIYKNTLGQSHSIITIIGKSGAENNTVTTLNNASIGIYNSEQNMIISYVDVRSGNDSTVDALATKTLNGIVVISDGKITFTGKTDYVNFVESNNNRQYGIQASQGSAAAAHYCPK